MEPGTTPASTRSSQPAVVSEKPVRMAIAIIDDGHGDARTHTFELTVSALHDNVGGEFELYPASLNRRVMLDAWTNENGCKIYENRVGAYVLRGLGFSVPIGKPVYGNVVLAPIEEEYNGDEGDGFDDTIWYGRGFTQHEIRSIEDAVDALGKTWRDEKIVEIVSKLERDLLSNV
jgi:hypothetical protein